MTTQPDHIEINPGKADGGPWVKFNGTEVLIEENGIDLKGVSDRDEITRATLTFIAPKITIYSGRKREFNVEEAYRMWKKYTRTTP